MHSSLTLRKPRPSRAFRMPLRLLKGLLLVVAASGASAQQVPGCGNLENAFGPFDYRPDTYVYETTYGSHKALVNIVERAHYTIETEMLVSRKTGLVVSPGADLSYTLRVFPNHHKALMTLIALSEKEKTDKPRDSIYTVDCWLKRAVAWKANDNVSKMIYAKYLDKTNRRSEAEAQLEAAARQAGDNVFTHHNLGLVYFDMKMYDKALLHANKTYSLGMTIPTLKDQLKSVNKWVESPDATVAEPAAGANKGEPGAAAPQTR